jgi:hypothetical protein
MHLRGAGNLALTHSPSIHSVEAPKRSVSREMADNKWAPVGRTSIMLASMIIPTLGFNTW